MKPTLDTSAAPLVMVTFYPSITVEEAQAHFRELSDAADELGRIGVVVDLSDAPSLSPSLWKVGGREMRAAIQRCGDKVVAVAHVIHSAPVRAMLAAVQWLAPPPFPTLVTSTEEDARSWVWAALRRTGVLPGPIAGGGRRDAGTVAGLARTLITAARSLGVPLDDGELASWGIARAQLGDLDAYVPYGTLMQLYDRLATRSGDDNFGLRVGAAFVDAASFGVVGVAAGTSAKVGDALARLVRHASLIDENATMAISADPAGLRVVETPVPPLACSRHHVELLMASILTLIRRWTGRHLSASAVGFRHRAPEDVSEHAGFFGCPPSFAANENFIVIPQSVAMLDLPHFDPVQARYFDGRLAELTRVRGVASGPLADVRAATLRQLSDGTPTLASIAHRLGMSSRTLQRRLSERGVTFGDILDSARREAAMAAIPRAGASVQEIASASGFADVKAFRRAFVRWTGKSPSEYRKTHP